MSAACGAAAAAYYCLHNSERKRREYEEEYHCRHPIIKYRVKVDILGYGTCWTIDFDTLREFKNWRKNVFNLNDNMIGFDLYEVENGIETKMDLADI